VALVDWGALGVVEALLDLAIRRAAIARDGVSVVALLALLDRAVAADRNLTVLVWRDLSGRHLRRVCSVADLAAVIVAPAPQAAILPRAACVASASRDLGPRLPRYLHRDKPIREGSIPDLPVPVVAPTPQRPISLDATGVRGAA
jgi:hypothetical protein